jgi:1-phosphofructokinase family hexose kinase
MEQAFVIRPTIICVSANPALDRRLRVPSVALGQVNRAQSVQVLAGGKAAHVAMAARALGAKAVWIGFLGGGAGAQVREDLGQLDIDVVPIQIAGTTRANLEIIEDSGRITEVLEPGCAPGQVEREEMIRVLGSGLLGSWKGAVVVISGSVPLGTPPDFYPSLIASAHAAGSKVLLDTSGDALSASLQARPDLVKPNRKEVEALLGRSVADCQSAADAARELVHRGAQSVAITLGAEGLVWLESKDGPAWIARPPRLKAVSTVGCGDATMAGFACAWARGQEAEKALRLAAACGAANCMAQLPGRIETRDVESLAEQIEIERCVLGPV